MRNRAKCKLCQSIIESFHSTDYVVCSCDQIAVDGGEAMRCASKNWENFIRISDDDKEVPVKLYEKVETVMDADHAPPKPCRRELLMMLDASIQSYENLPQHAMNAPATNADLLSLMLLMQAIHKV